MLIKICGVTTEQDALFAVGMGADSIGFNFVPSSVRQITAEAARDIAKRLPGGVITVGVFSNQPPEFVVKTIDEANLSTAQLHGSESPEASAWISERVPRVFKAFKAGELQLGESHLARQSLSQLPSYRAAAILVDGPEPGSGKVFDWSRFDGGSLGLPVILAGGLTPHNVAEAIAQTRPFGVDVASGVKSSQGVKDPELVQVFIASARHCAADLGLEATTP